MNRERFAYALLVALAGLLVAAAQQDMLSPKYAMWAALAASAVNGFLRVLWPAPPLPAAPAQLEEGAK